MLRFHGITKVVGLLGAIGLVGACGDNGAPDARLPQPPIDGGGTPDSEVTADTGVIDASAPDAAAAPSFSGTISVQEVSVQGIPQLGQGLQVTTTFSQNGAVGTMLFDSNPGMNTGCKVWEYTAAEAADPGLNEGTITITATDGTPAVPPCNFIPGAGYMCIGGAGAGGSIALVDATMGLWSLTDAEITDAASQVGRYMSVSGAATPGNNGAFPVVSSAGANTVIFVNANPTALPETLPATATFTFIAGLGPIPGTTDPGFLDDGDVLSIALAPGGDNDFEAFTANFPAGSSGVGNDFDLDTASAMTIAQLPTDGSAFSIGCDGAGGAGCTAGSALGSILTITTTDGSTVGTAPYQMPPPATIRRTIRCAEIGLATISVPAEVSAFIMTSGATRIQATFLRDGLQLGANAGLPAANWLAVAGHGVVGFTTP